MVTLHDKISDQVDLADRGRAGSDPAGRQSAAPVKSLTKIFTVLGRQIGCSMKGRENYHKQGNWARNLPVPGGSRPTYDEESL